MSREPAASRNYVRPAPYLRPGEAPLVPAAPQADAQGGSSGPPRLTLNNFQTFHVRVKKLPPDANAKAAVTTQLFQFMDRVCFSCAKCRRDNVVSDSVAVDLRNKLILCSGCFTRIIRPRAYRPSRVVPFPSLLSWLNYKPAKVMEVSEDVLNRPAEAVAPSGERMAVPMLAGGDRPTQIGQLPAIAMNLVAPTGAAAAVDGTTVGASASTSTNHPCCRVWGSCAHGETCLFRLAPVDLCLAFLMGLCPGGEDCKLLHQNIYDLPPAAADHHPAVRQANDLEERDGEWARWLAKRRNSPNMAEWQLWNNGPLEPLLDQYVPAAPMPSSEAGSDTAGSAAPSVKLSLTDIMSALKQIKKE